MGLANSDYAQGNATLALVTQPAHHSGLPGYLCDGLHAQGLDVQVVDARSRRVDRLWPALRAWHPNRETWLRRRWEQGLFSPSAWIRNTRRNSRLLDGLVPSPDFILQIGNCYFPHIRYRERPYYLFITAPLRQTLKDGKPWRPNPRDIPAFLELERELYCAAAHVFVPAAYVKNGLVDDYGVDAEYVSVVGMGVDERFLKNSTSIADTFRYRCLFVGWDFEMKGGTVLLEAFSKVRQAIPNLELDIVGPTSNPEWQQPGVHFLGAVHDRDKLMALYRNADLFVMPSHCDSFGFVFLEAMSQGMPCVGCHVNAMPDIIRDGETGYLVPPHDAKALANVMLDYYGSTENRKRMGERARERVREHYTWDKVVQTMLSVMRTTTSGDHDKS